MGSGEEKEIYPSAVGVASHLRESTERKSGGIRVSGGGGNEAQFRRCDGTASVDRGRKKNDLHESKLESLLGVEVVRIR